MMRMYSHISAIIEMGDTQGWREMCVLCISHAQHTKCIRTLCHHIGLSGIKARLWISVSRWFRLWNGMWGWQWQQQQQRNNHAKCMVCRCCCCFFLFLWTLNRRIRKWHARSKDAKHDWYSFISVYAHAIAHTSTTYIYIYIQHSHLALCGVMYQLIHMVNSIIHKCLCLLVRSLACLLKPNDIYLSKNLNFHHSLNHLNTICGYIHDCLASLCSLFAVFVVIAAMKLWIDWYVLLCVMVLSYSRCMVISRNVFICSFAVAIQCTQHTRAHCVESQPTNHRNCRLFYPFDDERTHVCVPPNADTSRHLKVRSAI